MKRALSIPLLLFSISCMAQLERPSHLMTDLVEHTDRVFRAGYDTNMTLDQLANMRATEAGQFQFAEINSSEPMLSWQVCSSLPNTLQTAYQILMASKPSLLTEDKADIWDSGRTEQDASTSIPFQGKTLEASHTYYWCVRVWDNHGNVSPWSSPRAFRTAQSFTDKPAHYPLQKTDDYPTYITHSKHHQFVDFGKATFAQLSLTLTTDKEQDTVVVHLSEKETDERVDRKPGGSIRYTHYTIPIYKGTHTYDLQIRHDGRNTDPRANESGVLPADRTFDPEQNIAAACRYIRKVSGSFAQIPDADERIRFTLAAYNGGVGHVQDAQTLARKNGRDPHRWQDVSAYILLLSQPQYYRDPDVRHGYMRGSETEAYVRRIMERWAQYRTGARAFTNGSTPAPSRRSMKDGEFQSKVRSAAEFNNALQDTVR